MEDALAIKGNETEAELKTADLETRAARALALMNRFEEAESKLGQSLELLARVPAATPGRLGTLGRTYIELGGIAHRRQDGRALDYYQQALETYEQAYGGESRFVMPALNRIAYWMVDANRLEEAEATIRRCLDLQERLLGAETLPVSRSQHLLGCDVDRDCDVDLVTANSSFDEIVWWENTTGAGSAWAKHVIEPSFSSIRSVDAKDLDGDGDVDVLGASSVPGEIAWWENTAGDGTAWTKHGIVDLNNAGSVYGADLDDDGAIDALGAEFFGGGFSWWRNRGGQFALPTADAVAMPTPNEGASNVLALAINGEHRGLAGEAAAELATIQLLFEESPGDPLTNQEFSDLIDVPRFYIDDGDDLFEPGSDDLELALGGPLFANDGLVSATFVDGDPSVEISFGTPVSWWVALDFEPGAGRAVAGSFIVSHLTESTSTGRVAGTDIPLKLEYSANVSSAPIAVNGAPFVAIAIPDRTYGVGGAVSSNLAPFFDDPELDALTFSAAGLPASLSLSPEGLLTGTPTADDLAGSPYTVTVTAADSGGLEGSEIFELAIRVAELFADSFESGDMSMWHPIVTP